ncbi:MAG: hypothetical protein LBI09_01245, partial [Nitrososphaerota archaeon]|nr:hypothetical protein [Nitrososphaerota archaeon]
GVPISIDAVDPNGNYVTLGTTVSDASGRFSFSFTPEMEGQYDIYAIFDGSDAYYKSNAQTEIIVMPTTASSTNYALYAFIVGIVLVIVVVFAVLLLLKKK